MTMLTIFMVPEAEPAEAGKSYEHTPWKQGLLQSFAACTAANKNGTSSKTE